MVQAPLLINSPLNLQASLPAAWLLIEQQDADEVFEDLLKDKLVVQGIFMANLMKMQMRGWSTLQTIVLIKTLQVQRNCPFLKYWWWEMLCYGSSHFLMRRRMITTSWSQHLRGTTKRLTCIRVQKRYSHDARVQPNLLMTTTLTSVNLEERLR